MFTYEVDGKKYTYLKEIGQEEAERRVRAFNEKQATLAKARGGGSYEGSPRPELYESETWMTLVSDELRCEPLL